MNRTYYNQMDSRWKNHPYPAKGGYENKTIGTSGCGPTCGAMIVTSSQKEVVRPDAMGDIFIQQGYRVPGGTDMNCFNYIAQRWGFETRPVKSSFEAHQACKDGYFVAINVGPGLWTTGGHFLLAVGANDKEIQIFDPYLYAGKFDRSGRKGKVRLEGNSAWVEINTFKQYSNAQRFIALNLGGTTPTPQPEPRIKYVNTSSVNLNVREAPNSSAKIVGSLPKGTQVTVYEDVNGWSKIGDNKYVSSQYLSDSAPDTPKPTTKTMYVKTNGAKLNVRQIPSPNGKIVGSIANGTKVTVYEEQNGWSRIGQDQWVSSAYLATSSNSSTTKPVVKRNTVGQTKTFKQTTKIYKNSNLTGTAYTYKAGTTVIVQANVSDKVDKVKVKATGRIGYVNISNYR